MQLLRMFSTAQYKGKKGYLKTQKKYEILRTFLYFGISLSLFAAGYITTKTRLNLLTVVAILGCLPASKSAVGMIMFLRFRGCSEENAKEIEKHSEGLFCLYDMVFTSYQKNYNVAHLAVKGNTVCGYTQDGAFDEQSFYQHIDGMLKADGLTNVSVKIFKDLSKYTSRLEQMGKLDTDQGNSQKVIDSLKNIAL